MLGLTRYQWLVLFAAWLGWGFDVFDGLLFNYVAPMWWSCSAFIPLIADHLADEGPVLDGAARALRVAENIQVGTNVFNLGGLIGTLLTVPAALVLGRRRMYVVYFALSAASLWLTFLRAA